MGEELTPDRKEICLAKWKAGLPSGDDLPPLSQLLIPPSLAFAFSIQPELLYTSLDVDRATHNTISSLRGSSFPCTTYATTNDSFNFKCFIHDNNSSRRQNRPRARDHEMREAEQDETRKGSDPMKLRRMEPEEDVSAMRTTAGENCMDDQSAEAKTLKRARLVWTPQLHKRFVEAVAHLGLKNAVPKSIMQLMNVEGLTRENVASHLQKYRLYVKRMQGLSNEFPSASSDKLFASMPVPPHSINESSSGTAANSSGHGNEDTNRVHTRGSGDDTNHVDTPIAMLYPPPSLQILPMPMMGMGLASRERGHGQEHGLMRMPAGNTDSPGGFHAYETHSQNHQYQQRCIMQQHRDGSGNKHNGHLHIVTPND